MPRTVSASEAKTRFGSIANQAVADNEEVIVESYGQPKVVIVPFEEYQKMTALREEARRREALARLEALREKVRARNQDLSAEEADALADQVTRAAIQRLSDKGKIRYQSGR